MDKTVLPFNHPNRPRKRRGDKLNSWSHQSTPAGPRGILELEDPQITSKMTANKKKKQYRMDYCWKDLIRTRYPKWGDADGWSRSGKYIELKDAVKAFENALSGKGFAGMYDAVRLVDLQTGKVIRAEKIKHTTSTR